jgi:acetoin utilization protein AcuB
VTVADRMVEKVIALQEDQSLRDALLIVQKHQIRHLPVLKDGKLVGMVTDRDLKRATPSPISGADVETFDRVVDGTRVSQLMTRNPFTVTPSTRLKDAVKVLHDRKFGALPVIDGNRLVGLITATDMLMDLHNLLPD